MIIRNLSEANNQSLPAFYPDHGIISTVDVVIPAVGWSELWRARNRQPDAGPNDIHDFNFLTGFANVLAEAVASAAKNKALRFMLEEKNLLAEELQHRVRNNLQMISGMLSGYARGAADNSVRQSIDAIVRRVTTLAQVYDSLLGVGLSHTVDPGSDLRERCISVPELQDPRSERIDIVCQADSMPLSLDSVTALGIVVVELVTNSFDHAFPDRGGTIVVMLARAPGSRDATLLIKDDGVGYVAKIERSRRSLGLVKRLMEQVRGRRVIRGDGLAAGRRLGS